MAKEKPAISVNRLHCKEMNLSFITGEYLFPSREGEGGVLKQVTNYRQTSPKSTYLLKCKVPTFDYKTRDF